MSATIPVRGDDPRVPLRERRLRPVPDGPLAPVLDIASAPSARRRRAALLAEDPSMRRRPVVAGSVVGAPAVRPGVGMLARRVVVGVIAASAALGIGVGAGLLAQPDPYSGPTITHSVAAGESVWGLAASVGSGRPLEQVVIDIEQLNHIDGGLTVGQEVVLPVR